MTSVLRNLLLGLLIMTAVCPVRSSAQEQEDSISKALSAIISGYLLQDLPDNIQDSQAFIKGLGDARTNTESKNYYYGLINGLSVMQRVQVMRNMGLPVNEEKVFGYLIQMLENRNTGGISNEEANNTINIYFNDKIIGVDTVSQESQREFIDSISKLDGATEFESGIIIVPLSRSGNIKAPVDGSTVMVSYEGRLSDGSVFDKTDTPIEMTVGDLVEGFNEGLKNMNVGDTIRLIIPAELGYGPSGIPGAIPGNSALDFTITLEEIIN